MSAKQFAPALLLAFLAGCGGADVAAPTVEALPEGRIVTASPELIATLGQLGTFVAPTLDRIRAREGAATAADALAALAQTRAAFAAVVAAGDPVGAYDQETRLRLATAARIAAELGNGPWVLLADSAARARDQLRARLRDGSGDGSGPTQDRLRLTERLCAAATAAAAVGRLSAAYDYAAQALETAAGWEGPPEWVARFGAGGGDRLRLRDGSCDADGDGIPDRDRERARDGTGPGH